LFKHFDHTKFPQLKLIHCFVHTGMLFSSVNLLHRVLCLFVCFSNCAYLISNCLLAESHETINHSINQTNYCTTGLDSTT